MNVDMWSKNARRICSCVGRQSGFPQCVVHQLHPAVAGSLMDRERQMPRAQAGMASLFDIAFRAAKPVNQKIAQPLFGAGQIVGRVHRAEHIVAGDLPVESGNETREALLANLRKNLVLFH